MNKPRLAALFREIASELEREEVVGHAAPAVVKRSPSKRVRKPFVPQRQLSELEIVRARQRAKKLGIPLP